MLDGCPKKLIGNILMTCLRLSERGQTEAEAKAIHDIERAVYGYQKIMEQLHGIENCTAGEN